MRIVPSLTALLIVFILCGLPGYGQEDLKVSISTSHVNANPGDEITYVIKYSNTGISPASNLVIKDYLASGLYTYVSSSPSGTLSGDVITWDQTQIPELALLSNGEFQIAVTVKAGIPGNGVTQASNGYYISAIPSTLENYATISSSYTTIPVQSNPISTKIEQNCGVHVNNASGVIKSATNTMVYYLIQVTNTGNVFDRYNLSSINFDCDGPGELGYDAIQATFTDQNGNSITQTDWIAPDQTYYFLLKLKADRGTNPGHWSCHNVVAISTVGGITGEGNIQTKVEGSPHYALVSLSKIDAKDPVEAGDVFTYTIYAFNSNDAFPAKNMVIKETYPPNITFISATPAPDPGFNNQWSIGNLDYGLSAAKTINITVRVNPLNNCNGTMTNTVSASYDDYNSFNAPSASVVTTIKSYPDLVITKTAQTPSTPAKKGETISYTINYQNAGTCDAPNSQIKEEFDDEHINIISAGGTQSGNVITWNLGLLNPGQPGTITYTALIDPESTFDPGTTQITSKATISTSETEPNKNNNTATASVSVSVLPDMKVEILPVNQTSDAGTEYTYTVKVSNVGDIAATNVEIKNLLPTGLAIGTISHDGNNIGGTITWPVIPTFEKGEYVEYQVKATPSCSFVPSFTSVATVTSAIIDKDETNNSVTVYPVVQDMQSPVLANIPPDVTVDCESIPAVGSPTAKDNCDGAPIVHYLGEASTRGTNPLLPDYYNYKLTRSWDAVDAFGNHSLKGTQVITVEDVTPPETPVLADVTVGECSGTPVAPTTTDLCKGTVTGTTTTVFPITTQGPTVVTWRFDDTHGNVITANQNVIVKDVTVPIPDIADLPAITAECSVTVTAPTATDNCKGQLVGTTTDPLTYSDQGNYTIHWTYEDGNGNAFTQTQSVVVDDTTPPETPVLADVTVGECSGTPVAPTTRDLCKGTVTGTTATVFPITAQGSTVVTWRFDDTHGNVITANQNVIVKDVTAPLPDIADLPVISEECSATVTAPTATDNCKGKITGTTTDPLTYSDQGNYTINWTYEDGNGNTFTQTQSVVVDDTTPPEIPDLADVTVGECSGTPVAPTTIDLCKGTVTGTTTTVFPITTQGPTVVTWRFDDTHGNVITANQNVIVKDVTAPLPDIADLPVISEECSATVTAPTATDNCKGKITGTTTDPLTYSEQGNYTINWTYEDGNGNTFTQTQSVVVDDTTPPETPVLADVTVGECSGTPVAPTTRDLCKGTVTGTTATVFPITTQGPTVVTWRFDDTHGNVITANQNVIVANISAPVPDIATLPNATGECSVTVNAPMATENCNGKIVGTTTDPLTYSEQGNYTIHWTYEDGNGNTFTQEQTVIVADTKAPLPDIADLPVISGECSVTVTAPTATDNCKGKITGTTTDPLTYSDQGNYTIHWTYEDGNGNTFTQTQSVVVDDTTPPETPVLADVTVGECSGTPATPTTRDLCKGTVTGTTTTVLPITTQGSTVVTWRFDDTHGNVITANQNVIVKDVTAPLPDIADLPAITAECSATVTAPTATDNCKGKITGTTTDPLTYSDQGNYTINWTYEDGNGNTYIQEQTVIVDDTKAPVADLALLPTLTGQSSITVTAPTATDNCKGIITGTTPDPLTYTVQGNYTIHWTYDDGNGNTSTQTQSIVVDDSTPPETPVLADVTVGECSGTPVAPTTTDNTYGVITGTTLTAFPITVQGTTIVTWTFDDGNGNITTANQNVIVDDVTAPVPNVADLSAITGECSATVTAPTATDNCKGQLVGTTTDPLTYSEQGIYTIHWTYDDGNGNTFTQTQSVVVDDTTPPETPVLADVFLGECSGTPPIPTTMDNCAGIVKGTTSILFPKTKQGKNTIIWTFDDGNGNVTTAYQNLILKDISAPVPDQAPLPVITAECSATVTAPIATDNCKGKITGTTTDPLTYSEQGIYTIHWTYDDGNGNISTQTQSVVVDDTTPPETPVLADVFLGECSGTPPIPTTMDNCAGIVKGTTSILFPKTKQGKNTIIWTFDDGNGNVTTAYQNLILKDISAPVPDEETLAEVKGQCSVTATAPSATDNCKGKIVGTTTDPLTYSEQGIYTIHWTYDDGNGNISTQTQNVVVDDTTAPETPVLADLTVGECSGTPTAPTTTDLCKGIITGTTTAVFPISSQGVTVVTWTFEDGNGNVTTAKQNVIVEDNTPPQITGTIANTTVEGCSVEEVTPPVNNVAALEALGLSISDACMEDQLLTVTSKDVLSDQLPITVTRTYTIKDAGNNSTDYIQTIMVIDKLKPTIVCPADLNITADAGSCNVTGLTLSLPVTSDNCSISSVTNDAPSVFGLGKTVVTWTVVDKSGNTAICQQNVTVDGIPVAVDDIIAVDENSQIAGNVTANDKGLCDTPIHMNIIAEPEFGSLTFSNDGSFEYIPDDNYFGKDKFTYQICDNDGDCSSAIVEITINSKNDQPLANADTENLQVDVTWHGNVAVNDVLSGDGNNVWTLKTSPSKGTILFNKDGTYTYTPQTSFIGNDSFSYELCDANGDCSRAMVTIHVEDVLLPNQILTPNSDDHNDTFIITGIEYYPINKVTVYNRWGNVVYSKNNYQNEWDGASKVSSKPLPVGTYYYLIDYGNNRHKTGFVYLDR